eukprot:11167218-Lingulodinium_polyedra.AAC.1
MFAKLYKNSRAAARELEDFVRSPGLEKRRAAMGLPALGLVPGWPVARSAESDIISTPAAKVICRKLYGLSRAAC